MWLQTQEEKADIVYVSLYDIEKIVNAIVGNSKHNLFRVLNSTFWSAFRSGGVSDVIVINDEELTSFMKYFYNFDKNKRKKLEEKRQKDRDKEITLEEYYKLLDDPKRDQLLEEYVLKKRIEKVLESLRKAIKIEREENKSIEKIRNDWLNRPDVCEIWKDLEWFSKRLIEAIKQSMGWKINENCEERSINIEGFSTEERKRTWGIYCRSEGAKKERKIKVSFKKPKKD